MADIESVKISQLPEALTTSDSDAVLVVQGNKAKKARPSLFKGKKGDPGENAYLRYSGGWVQWRLGIAGSWVNLIPASDLEGDSAYQVAVNNGFKGTEQEWIASLSAASESAAAIALAAAKTANDTNTLVTTAEAARVTAEQGRVTEEGKRVTAETSRNTEEGKRKTAESARVTAEQGRVTEEGKRVTAESGRVTAETKRQTDTGKAIGDTNTATTAANNAAGRANAAAAISEELNAHPPVQQAGPEGNLTWWVWNLGDKKYVDTGLPARGPQGKPLIVLDNGNYGFWNDATEQYVDSGILAAAMVDFTNITPASIGAVGKSETNGGSVYTYTNPISWQNKVDSATGTIKINLPKGWTSEMMTIEIDLFQYNSNSAAKIIVSGYNYLATSAWYNYRANVLGYYGYTVRLGYDSTAGRCCILLGDITSVFPYPIINISKVTVGYGSATGWNTGYTIEQVTSESNITKIVTAPLTTYSTFATTSNSEKRYVLTNTADAVTNYYLLGLAYNGTNIARTSLVGELTLVRGSDGMLNKLSRVSIVAGSAYNTNMGSTFNVYKDGYDVDVVTLVYNSVKYLALRIGATSSTSLFTFTGEYTRNGSNSNFQRLVDGTDTVSDVVVISNSNIRQLRVNDRLTIDTTGRLVPASTSTRRTGMYGVYDAAKTGHIWSMGTSYMIPDDGVDFGNLYGLAYKNTANTTGGTMAGGHQAVWCENGTPKAALGANGVWAAGGFRKEGSSDAYLLTGAGGHLAASSFSRGAVINTSNITGGQWVRIAQSPVSITRCMGLFSISCGRSGIHSTTTFAAYTNYGTAASTNVHQIAHSGYTATGISQIRIVWHTTYADNYAYVEVYLPNAGSDYTLSIRMDNALGFSLLSPVAGSIPSGYTSIAQTLSNSRLARLDDNVASATKLATARTINGTSFDGSANVTTANWGTARTMTIGGTGKSVNGSGNVSWSLTEIGAAASSHTHSYLPLSGGTLTGKLLNSTNNAGMWLDGITQALIDFTTVQSENSYHAYMRVKNYLGHVVNIGGLGNSFGFWGYYNGRTANGRDWGSYIDMSTGNWTHEKIFTAAQIRRSGSSDSYLLLGGGGHKAVSDFAAKTVQKTDTLGMGRWTGSGPYSYVLSDTAVTANSFVTLWPTEASRQAARDADIFEDVITGAGTITIKATNIPATNISVKYKIEN
jgi:hypothetical protein